MKRLILAVAVSLAIAVPVQAESWSDINERTERDQQEQNRQFQEQQRQEQQRQEQMQLEQQRAQPQNIYTNPGGATDNRGNAYSPAGNGNLVRGTDGTVMERQGDFYLNTRTGQMVPVQ